VLRAILELVVDIEEDAEVTAMSFDLPSRPREGSPLRTYSPEQ